MEREFFSPMAIDALGEMMNISLGSSATAVSNMLDHRVDITTPTVSVVRVEEFSLGNLEPAMGVEIKYVSGLEGSNIMLLKRSDIKVIVDILMGTETPDEEFELNELTVSAVCEVMNQMMGAASTALSDFLGRMINISTPASFELDDLEGFKKEHFPQGEDTVVVIRFALSIEGALESEFMNVMSVQLARELVSGFGLDEPEEAPAAPAQAQPAPRAEPAPEPAKSGGLSQAEIERLMASMGSGGEPAPQQEAAPPAPAPAEPAPPPAAGPQSPAAAAPPTGQTAAQDTAAPGGMPPFSGGYMGYPPMYYPPYPYPAEAQPPQPKLVNAQPAQMPQLDVAEALGEEQAQNLDLIMEVPLEVTVEIGRTRRKVQDILAFSKGALVVLDKLAGDQVDLFVNGKCIARGDVVVIDDNFGIRITEIIQKPILEGMAKK